MYDRMFAWEACLWKSKHPDFVSEVQSFLGRGTHSVDGVIDEDLRDKIRGFQSTFHLPITGEIDQATAKAVSQQARLNVQTSTEPTLRMSPGEEAASAAERPFS
jgi:hypothetical protein